MKVILFIEDDEVIVQAYGAGLVRAGFQVEVASDGLAAMKVLLALKPDLVLLDIIMPKLDGNDVLKYIRSTPALKATPVIILSTASIADLARSAIALGPERVFLKGQCSLGELVSAVKELLGDRTLSQPPVAPPPATGPGVS